MPENAAAEGGFGRDAPDRSRDTENNRGDAREDKESRAGKAESFDRAMNNANRPDRTPVETTTASNEDDDDKKDDKSEDRPDRAAASSGATTPTTPTDTAAEPEDDDRWDERGLLDRVTDALTAPPTDTEGNARPTSSVADRFSSHTINYSLDNVFGPPEPRNPGLTSEQSATLAQSAAVMNGYAFGPAIPSTADLVLDDVLSGMPEASIGQRVTEERGWTGYAADGGAFGAGVVVGAGERALDLASESFRAPPWKPSAWLVTRPAACSTRQWAGQA